MMTRKGLRTDEEGAIPSVGPVPGIFVLLAIVVIAILLLGGFLVVIFATKTLIVVALIGLGMFLLVKHSILASFGEYAQIGVPFLLIALGILFYVGTFKFLGG